MFRKSGRIFFFIIISVFFSLQLYAQKKTITLVIDAGHGGKDPGMPSGTDGMKHEKDIKKRIFFLFYNKIFCQ